ncbi:TRAP-T family transporter, DctM (12 TMs) subunit [Pseudooceanicola batsensis HTCC2597]|uniref:TRAP transporter large permease protein n=1 Tax=Pseudooceanicola batsensis (strain ATCC BAA-863 / DSM 15984 / KCTC 12145 / HTCC2597) TaxID=252305 RepID=A3TZG7_PSEBH|nr:TRAP transporter large permease [Pseudooceanicola batsensis]EAQ02448.1 TRAP-T family transporter, DctM (12 TMs) subunit [Pseudooceanicola batsensis HTCC2597]
MTDLQIAGGSLAIIVFLVMLRMPIAIALLSVSFGGIWMAYGYPIASATLTAVTFDFSTHSSLSPIPMFLLMGFVAYYAKMTTQLFDFARASFLMRLPGGLAVASIGGSAMFSAVTGSSLACAAAMGRIAVPEMLRAGYQPGLATGVVAAAGTLGSMIPPSLILLLFGIFAQVPIGTLFIGAIIPGLLTAFAFGLMVVLRVMVNPSLAPRPTQEELAHLGKTGLRDIWPILLLIVSVFGGLFAGLFTATEAGAVGALLSIVIAAAKGSLSWTVAKRVVTDTLVSSAAILIIAMSATFFASFLALTQLPAHISQIVADLNFGPVGLMIVVFLLYLVLGMFLEVLGIMLLTLPVLLPLFETMDISLIWVGILLAKYLEMGLITPPVGLNVFVIKSVVGRAVPTDVIFRGIAWFVATDIVVVALLIAFPELTLWLPSFLEW